MKKIYFTLTLLMSSLAFFAQSAGDIIFTEIHTTPQTGGGTSEYFEVYNTTASPIDLNGWVIKDDEYHPVDNIELFTISGSLPIAAGGYVVFGRSTTASTGVTVDYEHNGVTLAGSSDGLILELADGTVIDAVNYDHNDTIWPAKTKGYSMNLDPRRYNSVDNDLGGNWCLSTLLITGGAVSNTEYGTPGATNETCATVEDPLGIKDNAILGFGIYPNPVTNGFLNIYTLENSSKSIEIFDLLGKQLLNQVINSTILDVSSLKSGLYILKVSENGKTSTEKLVIN